MNYNNISVVHLKDGIDVSFNDNESNKEVIFFFDRDKNFIQKTTYPVDIYSSKIENILKNTDHLVYIEKECFFYYSFYFQVSYAHYLTQCVPKLKYYMDNINKLLVIPRSTYTNFTKDIFNILGISDNKILILEDNIEYVFKNISTVEHSGSEWDGVGGQINYDGVEVYKKIRSSLKLNVNEIPHRKIYLKRDGKPNTLYGNGEVGIFRKIDNEDKLISFLIDQDFEIIELGSKSIKEKCYELRDIHTIITQIGANFMNLIFCNSVKNILLLSNDFPLGCDYYFGLIDVLNPIFTNKQIFTHPSSQYGVDPKNITNSPFEVDLHRIKIYLQSL